jgi:hypothetical protein
MTVQVNLKGQRELLRNLRRTIQEIEGDVDTGLSIGLSEIKADAVENAPVEFGVLRNSAFSQVLRRAGEIFGRVGFTADYAPFVHEMPEVNRGKPRTGKGKRGTYWQGGGRKFLERAVMAGLDNVTRAIRRFAKR